MVDFNFTRSFLKFRELLFCTDAGARNEDIVIYHSTGTTLNCPYLNQNKGIYSKLQLTVSNSLEMEENDLFSCIDKNFRYEIRRSTRENISTRMFEANNISNELLDKFEKQYNKMFSQKKMSLKFNRYMAEGANEAGHLFVSVACDENGDELVYHEYFADDKNAILIYSVSLLWDNIDNEKRKLIGYANKRLHWEDMLYFKKTGRVNYEWGGIASLDETDRIGKFKREFGGKVEEHSNCIVAKTIKGSIYVSLLKMRDWIHGRTNN